MRSEPPETGVNQERSQDGVPGEYEEDLTRSFEFSENEITCLVKSRETK